MMIRWILLLAALCCIVVNGSKCSFTDASTTVSFDFGSEVALNGIMGESFTETHYYSYQVSLCATTNVSAVDQRSTSGCHNNSYGFQYEHNTPKGTCHPMAEIRDDSGTAVLNKQLPTAGISLHYTASPNQTCSNGRLRQFTANVWCSPLDKQPVGDNLVLYELPGVDDSDHTCHYFLSMSSRVCPDGCLYNQTSKLLCGGRGFCGYDRDLKKAHCFCDSTSSGADCSFGPVSEESPSSCDGTCAVLSVFAAIIGVLVFFALLIFWRIRKIDRLAAKLSMNVEGAAPAL